MSRLHELLIEQYAEHYARANASINPNDAVQPRNIKSLQLMYGDLLSLLPLGSKVLDLGCGTGIWLKLLSLQPGLVVSGVDSSLEQVELAQKYLPNIEISCADGLAYLRQRPNAFSGIFCHDVLEHIPGEDLCLEWVESACAALQPNGFFCCRVPNAANLSGSYTRYMDLTHQRSFTRTSILQLLEASGLQGCKVIPIRSGHLSGRLRLAVEQILHRIIFRIEGKGLEYIFTSNVCAVGFKK